MPDKIITTTNHEQIKQWVAERGGKPSIVVGDGMQTHILRIDFSGEQKNLKEIEWDQWFHIFEEKKMQFLYQNSTSEGEKTASSKIISRDQEQNINRLLKNKIQ